MSIKKVQETIIKIQDSRIQSTSIKNTKETRIQSTKNNRQELGRIKRQEMKFKRENQNLYCIVT